MITRRASRSDVQALVRLRVEMFIAMQVTGPDDRWQSNADHWFVDRLDDPAYCLVVVEVSGQVVSCAVGAIRDAAPSPNVPDGREILISNVCTAPAHRGHGYGRAAFDAVMRWARLSGVGRVELMATESGRSMYERAGFRNTTFPAMRAQIDWLST